MKKGDWTLQNKDGTPVQLGDTITDFRNARTLLLGGIPPHKEGASGYVIVDDDSRYYAGVYDLVWVKL